MSRRLARRVLVTLLTLPALASLTQTVAAQAPRTGAEVLARMHEAYAGRWYRTLRFLQETEIRRPDGRVINELWHESVQGSTLRIDRGDLAAGNGMLYTADSTFVVRGGRVVRAEGEGNFFLPLIMGVYLQPPEETARQLTGFGFDLGRHHRRVVDGDTLHVVGAADASDSTSAQFWVEPRRWVVTRAILPAGPQGGVIDARLGGYVRAGDGWLSTEIVILLPDGTRQVERYREWAWNVRLDPALFDPARWSTAPHWGR